MWSIHYRATANTPNDCPIQLTFCQNLTDYNVDRTQVLGNRWAFHRCSSSIIGPDIVMSFQALIESRSNCHFAGENGTPHEGHAEKCMPLIAHHLLKKPKRNEQKKNRTGLKKSQYV